MESISTYRGVLDNSCSSVFNSQRQELSIWMILVIVLGVVDIIFGLYRKKEGE